MWIVCLAEDSHEISSLIFSEKQWKSIFKCRLLQSWLQLSGLKLPIASSLIQHTVKILKFGTPQTIAIIVLKIEKFDVTLH